MSYLAGYLKGRLAGMQKAAQGYITDLYDPNTPGKPKSVQRKKTAPLPRRGNAVGPALSKTQGSRLRASQEQQKGKPISPSPDNAKRLDSDRSPTGYLFNSNVMPLSTNDLNEEINRPYPNKAALRRANKLHMLTGLHPFADLNNRDVKPGAVGRANPDLFKKQKRLLARNLSKYPDRAEISQTLKQGLQMKRLLSQPTREKQLSSYLLSLSGGHGTRLNDVLSPIVRKYDKLRQSLGSQRALLEFNEGDRELLHGLIKGGIITAQAGQPAAGRSVA